jgi:hypothetical protein
MKRTKTFFNRKKICHPLIDESTNDAKGTYVGSIRWFVFLFSFGVCLTQKIKKGSDKKRSLVVTISPSNMCSKD